MLTDVNLVLRPENMYLVLGPPLSGKTSLLRAIGGMMTKTTVDKDGTLSGSVWYNNLNVMEDDDNDERTKQYKKVIRNLVAFVRQEDDHAARLTVAETFGFAASCKDNGGKKRPVGGAAGSSTRGDSVENKNEPGEKMDRVEGILEALGLTYVKDTFVGDENVRGVSGGQRRRVTLGEVSMNMEAIFTISRMQDLQYMS